MPEVITEKKCTVIQSHAKPLHNHNPNHFQDRICKESYDPYRHCPKILPHFPCHCRGHLSHFDVEYESPPLAGLCLWLWSASPANLFLASIGVVK
jgi:hypothetical protein